MTTAAAIVHWLDRLAPLHLAESWDNVGLLMGDPDAEVHRVMTTLSVTPTTAREAVREGAELVLSHHPILFRASQRLRADTPETAAVWTLAQAGIAVASPHTAYDNAPGGLNDQFAAIFGLQDVIPLRTSSRSPSSGSSKLVVFTPEEDVEAILEAAFALGAGRIGNYRECSFRVAGEGTFFGEAATNPTVGQSGRRELAPERRVEFVCPNDRVDEVLTAIREHHSYEEVAIDVYPLQINASLPGSGRLGVLPEPTNLGRLSMRAATRLKAPRTRFVGNPDGLVERVALCCGAGEDFLADAHRLGADVLITGEARYHACLEAEAREIGLILVGHHASERHGVETLAERLASVIPDLRFWPSVDERDPVQIFDAW